MDAPHDCGSGGSYPVVDGPNRYIIWHKRESHRALLTIGSDRGVLRIRLCEEVQSLQYEIPSDGYDLGNRLRAPLG